MLKLATGLSKKDRISFYTYKNGATAIRNENGEITVEYGKKENPITKNLAILLGFFCLLSLIKAFVIIPLIQNKTIGAIWYLILMFFYSYLLVAAVVGLRKNGGKDLLKNHGAEHKVYAAYKKLKRIPTVEEANRFSRINKNCGISTISAFITAQLIGFIVYIYTGYIIPEVLLFLIPFVCPTMFPFHLIGKVGQLFTTNQPEKCNIELAIAALSELERRELFPNEQIDDV